MGSGSTDTPARRAGLLYDPSPHQSAVLRVDPGPTGSLTALTTERSTPLESGFECPARHPPAVGPWMSNPASLGHGPHRYSEDGCQTAGRVTRAQSIVL